MKNSGLSLLAILMMAMLTFTACKKDDDSPSTGNGAIGGGNTTALSAHDYLSGDNVEANFRGIVSDESGQPIADVAVQIGNTVVFTDENGLWQILDASVDTERAYIRAQKDGYFHGSRVLTPSESGFNRSFITLMTASVAGAVPSAVGGVVTHTSGSSVDLPADGYVDAMGNAYNGNVSVQFCYLDPSSVDIMQQMPGNLTALETDNDFTALRTYGMIGVELVGTNGEELQLANGSSAEIRVALPSEAMATAPSSIPLWHFDEEVGIWRQEGSANLEGSEYVGTVAHFSFWNCDIPSEYIFLDGYVFGEEAAFPIQGVRIELVTSGLGQASAYSGPDGYFGGIVPAGVEFTMNVYSNCGDLYLTQDIGPFDSDVTVPNVIVVESDGLSYITGTLVDCGGSPGEGYVSAYSNTFGFPESVEVNPDGSFMIALTCAPQEVTVIGYAPDYLSNSGETTLTTVEGETHDLGAIDLCAVSTDQYIVMNIAGETYTFVDSLFAYLNPNSAELGISGAQFSDNNYSNVSFRFADGPTPSATDFNTNQTSYSINNQTIWGSLVDPSDMNWEFSSYTTVMGNYLEFSFSGTFSTADQEGLVLGDQTITGYGRVQRSN